jgi:hypothetical protein
VKPGFPELRCVFGQNAAAYQILGLLTVALAIAVLACAAWWPLRALGLIALPIGTFWYVVMGHAAIYGPFLWLTALRRRGPK